MEYVRKIWTAITSVDAQDVPSSAVQLTMKTVPDSEAEDCKTRDDEDRVDLISIIDFETGESSSPGLYHAAGELNESDGKHCDQRQDDGRFPASCSVFSEEGEDAESAANESLRRQIASLMRDNSALSEEVQSYKTCTNDLHRDNSALSKEVQGYETYTKDLCRDNSALSNEVQGYKIYANDLHRIISSQNGELSRFEEMINTLKVKNEDILEENINLTTSNRQMQKELRYKKTDPEPAALAIGTKVSDGELKSHWKQLKFSVRNLALLIADNIPEGHCPARMKRVSRRQKTESSRRMFCNPDLRSWAIEKRLWSTICHVVFESHSQSDLDEARHSFKYFKSVMLDRLDKHKSSRLGLFCKWFNDGWQIAKPSDEDMEMMLQKDCDNIFELVYGDGQFNDGAEGVSIQDDLRDIFSLAMELDNMRMQSRAMITIKWPDSAPRKRGHGSSPRGYLDAIMKAVNMDRRPFENAAVQLAVSPALLKKGNANGRNYDWEMVLAKADVLMHQEDDGNADSFGERI